MKKIGLIVAMDEELIAIKKIMKNIKINKIYELLFYEGTIENKDFVLVKCGVGKVNAARTTQVLIDNYDLDLIINLGSAGSLNDKLNIGDIVIGKRLIQHDFDITAFGHQKGYITDIGRDFYSDGDNIKICEKVINTICNNKVVIGTIVSGDIFCTDIKMKEKIRNKFDAECTEMEGAAIAQVCTLDKIPFIVIRAISDKLNGNNEIDFNTFLELASNRCAEFLKEYSKI